jgi:hypothetical protein
MTLPRWLILLGSIILFLGSLLHLMGYKFVVPALAKAGVDLTLLGAMKAVWLVFTVEIVILSPALIWISRRPNPRALLLFLALIPVIDGILMYHFVGLFIGTYIVAAGSLLLVVGAWLIPRDAPSAP